MSSPLTIGTAVSSTNSVSASSTVVASPSYTAGATLVAFAVGVGTGGTNATCSVSGGGVTWTQLATYSPVEDGAALNYWLSVYIAANANGSGNITATNAGSIASGTLIIVIPISGTPTSSVTDGAGVGSGALSTSTINTSNWSQSFGAGDLTIAGFFVAEINTGVSAPTGYTIQKQQEMGTGGFYLTVLTNPSQNGTSENGALKTTTAADWMGIALALKAAAPTVTSSTPSSGTTAGGTSITDLAGTGFFGSATVTFGGGSATSVTVVGLTEITCTTPSHAVGLVAVTVTNPDGQSGTGNVYTYTTAAATARELCLLGCGT